MCAQRQRARVLRLERLHQLRPDHAGGTQLGDLHEVIHADRPEKRYARCELVDGEPRLDAGAYIFDAVGERIGELEVLRRAGFLHVIAGHRNRIELWHLRGGVGEDVGDDANARAGRIDISVAHHEFFEDVVLDRARQFGVRHALFLGRDDVKREHRQHRAVHGHRHAHLVERNAGEQRAHVVDRVDGHARHADVAGHARMVAVVAAMGGEIEGDGEALLPGGEIAPVEGVAVLCRREAGILPDGPGLRRVHRRIRPAQIGRLAGIGVEEIETLEVVFAVDRLYGDRFRRHPRRGRTVAGGNRRIGEVDAGEIRDLSHLAPRISCAACKVETTSQPMNTKDFTPAASNSASSSPGLPARCTVAPAAVSALAASAACAS